MPCQPSPTSAPAATAWCQWQRWENAVWTYVFPNSAKQIIQFASWFYECCQRFLLCSIGFLHAEFVINPIFHYEFTYQEVQSGSQSLSTQCKSFPIFAPAAAARCHWQRWENAVWTNVFPNSVL
jgi:hypothetical protein